MCIITEKEEELRQFILNDLHSGATIYESYGAYNLQKRREIITIVDKNEYQKLMSYMNQEDPHRIHHGLHRVGHSVPAKGVTEGGKAFAAGAFRRGLGLPLEGKLWAVKTI